MQNDHASEENAEEWLLLLPPAQEVEAGVLCQALDRTSGRQSANLGSTSQIFASNADRHPDGQLATNSKAGVKDASQALACSAADRDQGMRDLHVEVTGIIGKGGGGVVYRGGASQSFSAGARTAALLAGWKRLQKPLLKMYFC